MKKTTILISLCALVACTTLPTSGEYAARGDGYLNDGKIEKAIAAYNKAIRINPANLEAYASRGAAHYAAGHYELAQQDFEYVLTKNPYHADTYTAYGSSLASRGNFQDALTVLNLAIQLKPDRPENYFSRAGVYFMLQDYPKAIADYDAVLRAYPAADVFNARGAVYLQMGKKELAEQDFEAAKSGKYPATLHTYTLIK